jgi:ATP-dependent exoDNAse (exonuclease V) beta subunit
LLEALNTYETIEFINQEDGLLIERARDFLRALIRRAERSGLSDLLRFAVEESEYRTVAAANFDGAQRLSNLEKLFTLAGRFERSGAYLIRDFVRFVHDFEEAGGRESEGQIDDSADAVRLMSIHQSKGQEFPVVIIPDLHRLPDNRTDWWSLDRHLGLTLKVPDGRGGRAQGSTYALFAERAKRRDEFESMRLLYVAATRAQDRLILSGAIRDSVPARSWLGWISKALGVGNEPATALLRPEENLEVMLTVNLADDWRPQSVRRDEISSLGVGDLTSPETESFPLLPSIEAERGSGLHRFNVTQLLNYQRCPRQYYFDRVLNTPGEEEISTWNNAEAPEPPANLTATLRGAVIHRFCEKFQEGDDLLGCLKNSFDDVLRQRSAELGDRILEIDSEKAVPELAVLARNYESSDVRKRIDSARELGTDSPTNDKHLIGALSEQRFRLRRPLGILTGSIDKLLIVPSERGGLVVEIIDFKTNRFRGASRQKPVSDEPGSQDSRAVSRKRHENVRRDQLSFDFLEMAAVERDLLLQAEIEALAIEYRVQMQAYALAARDLLPGVEKVRVTLHFLDPNVEVSLPDELLERDACVVAIDEVMEALACKPAPERFPACPAAHCRVCNFVEMCSAGRQWVSGF